MIAVEQWLYNTDRDRFLACSACDAPFRDYAFFSSCYRSHHFIAVTQTLSVVAAFATARGVAAQLR